MTKQVETEPEGKQSLIHFILLTTLLILPSVFWWLFGWVSCIIPFVVFVLSFKYGWKYANRRIGIAALTALAVSSFYQSIELTLFSLSFVPSGYVSAYSALRKDKPWLAGCKVTFCLAMSLFVFFSLLLMNSDISFFTALNESLTNGIDEALRQYSQSETLSVENYAILEQSMYHLKSTAPIIMPSILVGFVILIAWATLILGNKILPRMGSKRPWPGYRFWSLPDPLVWGLIVAGILALISEGTLKLIGINVLIIVALAYSFQGLAILVFLLNKWNVPKILRKFMYVMIILQSFGTIILVGVGIADVWFDLRRLRMEIPNNNLESE